MASVTASPTPSVVGPTPSATSRTPSPTATASSTPSRSADPATADVFSYAGYGRLRLGMTASEGTRRDIVRPLPDDVCGGYVVSGPYRDEPLGVTFGAAKELVEVSANRPGPVTWKGARVGMTWGQVRQRHPDATIVAKNGNGGPFYAAQLRGQGAMILFLAVSEKYSDNWYGGTLMDHPDWPASQEITAIVLSPYSDGVYGGC
ncbi:hypothetical protein [Raineyella antarctica]|nr:hypothetical protein [Raineyella antarctica]